MKLVFFTWTTQVSGSTGDPWPQPEEVRDDREKHCYHDSIVLTRNLFLASAGHLLSNNLGMVQ